MSIIVSHIMPIIGIFIILGTLNITLGSIMWMITSVKDNSTVWAWTLQGGWRDNQLFSYVVFISGVVGLAFVLLDYHINLKPRILKNKMIEELQR